jgi:hypothetical protein
MKDALTVEAYLEAALRHQVLVPCNGQEMTSGIAEIRRGFFFHE